MNPVRPTYEIPEEAKQQLGLRQSLLNAEMPGQRQATENIYTGQANALSGLARGAQDQGQYLSGLAAIAGGTNNALDNLQTQQAQNYYRNVQGLENAQNNMANYEDKAFEINKMDPYLMELQRKDLLKQAGSQNILGGINGISNTASGLLGMLGRGVSSPLGGQVAGSFGSPMSNLGPASLAPGGANLAAMAGNPGGIAALLPRLARLGFA